jgi:amino acid adenylation domain-containing protein
MEVAAAVERLAREESTAAFDLTTGPLIRGRLVRVGDQEHVLLITMHHIVSDAWSIGILIRELSTLYSAYREGLPSPLPALKIQYADYAQWQRRWLQGEVLQGQLNYWKKHLEGAPGILQLPTDRERPTVQRYQGGSLPIRLGASLSRVLKELSQHQGTTLFMTLYAGFAVMLSKLSGQQDVVIGTAIANRQRAEVEGLIGFFVNTLALRAQLHGELSVGELLRQVKETTLGAYAHQGAPFEQVVGALQPVRSLSHSPVFQVMFVLQNAPQGELQLPGLRLSPHGVSRSVSQFDLTLTLQEIGDEIAGTLNYATALFDEATIQRWTGYLQRVYEQVARDADRELKKIALLDEGEREQLLHGFNATEVAYPQGTLIHQLFEAQVRRTPNAIAVMDDDEQLTYAELNGKANQLARSLRAHGVGAKQLAAEAKELESDPVPACSDQLVGICLERGVPMVVGLLGILKAGAAYVPLDPNYPPERLQYMLEDAAPRAVLTQSNLRGRLPASTACTVCLDTDSSAIAQHPANNPSASEVRVTAQDLAYVIYTSGSTGEPKGVMIEHRNTVNLLHWARESLEGQEFARTLASTSLNFDLAVYECFVPLTLGGVVRVRGNALQVESTDDLTLINTVPSAMSGLLDRGGVPTSTRVVNLAGEALKRTLVERIFAQTQVEKVCNLYGPSETTTYSTWVPMSRRDGFNSSIGVPIANTRIYLLDGAREPVPTGVVGEIYIGGAGVARGYLNREELTHERFVQDPFRGEEGSRMYKTGDLGRWLADGTIEYLGRNDHQVKIRGYRIELGEIESRLCQHPQVSSCVVVAREDEPGNKRLVAYFTAKEPAASAEELREHLRQQLPEYMVPNAFVVLEQLPLTPNGKVDRTRLAKPEHSAYAHGRYVAAENSLEERLVELWQHNLGLTKVGTQDNYFAIGGDSIRSISLVASASRVGVVFRVKDLFTHPTIAELARAITQDAVEQEPTDLPGSFELLTADEKESLLEEFS